MDPATKATGVEHSAAHLRVVGDRARAGSSGIQLSGVSKTYRSRDGDVASLRPLDFHINAGEFFVVVGPPGCGKSTLQKIVACLLSPPVYGSRRAADPLTRAHGNVGIVFHNS